MYILIYVTIYHILKYFRFTVLPLLQYSNMNICQFHEKQTDIDTHTHL